MRRHRVAGGGVGVEPHAEAAGGDDPLDPPRAGTEVVGGILGVDPALDRMAAGHDVLLREAELLAGGHPDLRLHQVDTGHHLAHRVLHLDSRVDLDEIKVVLLVDDELDCAGRIVAGGLCQADSGLAHLFADFLRQAGRRALLDQLLVPSLRRAVAFPEMHDVAVLVAQDLDLHVPRPLDIPLDVDAGIAEGSLRLGRSLLPGACQGQFVGCHPHALAAAAGSRLEQHRIADFLGHPHRLLLV